MSIGADVANVAVVALVPLLYRTGLLALPVLMLVITIAGGLRGFGDLVKRAVFPLAVEASAVDLTRATALHDGIDRLAFLLGGALSGVLIAGFGAPNVLLFDAGTFGVAALVVAAGVGVADSPCDRAGA